MKPQDKVFLVIGSIAIIGAATAGGLALFVGGSDASGTTTPTTSQTSNSASTSTNNSSTGSTRSGTSSTSSSTNYKDGTYTATAYYMVPRGDSNSVKTTLTIAGGRITAVSTTNNTQDNESAMYISSFKQYVESEVVGQSLNGYYGSRIGGASLTTEGFNQTLDTIRNDAAA